MLRLVLAQMVQGAPGSGPGGAISPMHQLEWVGLVALAGVLGGVVGLEREVHRKPAGLRTHIFVAAGSALFMVLGYALTLGFLEEVPAESMMADPIRTMQAVVIGISFLGAGTIIHDRGRQVAGLTTAASILLASGIGIAVAARQFVLAVLVTLLTVVVLVALGSIERWLGKRPSEES